MNLYVSEFGGGELVLSVSSAENAKPTEKLEKCRMSDNGCYWENPVYETVKFIQDPKNGKIQDRIYHFVISTGSSKGSVVLGEFSVNVVDFVGATKACSVSFPFQSSNSDAHFHVSNVSLAGALLTLKSSLKMTMIGYQLPTFK